MVQGYANLPEEIERLFDINDPLVPDDIQEKNKFEFDPEYSNLLIDSIAQSGYYDSTKLIVGKVCVFLVFKLFKLYGTFNVAIDMDMYERVNGVLLTGNFGIADITIAAARNEGLIVSTTFHTDI